MGWGGVGSIVRVPGDVSASGRVGWIGVGWGGGGGGYLTENWH